MSDHEKDHLEDDFQEEVEGYIVDQEPEISWYNRLFLILTSPIAVFEDIKKNPKPIAIPMLVLGMIMAIGMIFILDIQLEYSQEMFYEMRGTVLEGSQITYFKISTIVTVFIMGLLTPLIKASIAHGIGMLLGSVAEFKKTVSVIVNSYVIVAFSSLIRNIVVMATGNLYITFSPAMFMNPETSNSMVFTLLASLDLFTIWYIVISIIGFSIVHKMSKQKAAIAIALPYIISIVFSIFTAQQV